MSKLDMQIREFEAVDRRKEAMAQEDSFFDSQASAIDDSDSEEVKVDNTKRRKKRRPVMMTEKIRLLHL